VSEYPDPGLDPAVRVREEEFALSQQQAEDDERDRVVEHRPTESWFARKAREAQEHGRGGKAA
jgi:hypothetical protein